MKLSILIPVFNELQTIEVIINEVLRVEVGIDKELVVVDDASTDGTREFLEKFSHPQVKKVFHKKNSGKGTALASALEQATGDIILIQDADLEYPPAENYRGLIEPIVKGYADVVYGSRFLGVHRVFMFWHYLANKLLILITNILYNTMLSDMETGAKVFRAEVLKNMQIRSRRFNVEPEITAKVFKKGFRVQEVPIVYCGRTYREGKKIGFLDFLEAIWTLLWYRFFP